MSNKNHKAFVNSFNPEEYKMTPNQFDASHDAFIAFCQTEIKKLEQKIINNVAPQNKTSEPTK